MIVFIDIESTGTDLVKDKIVQLSMLRFEMGSTEVQEVDLLINPGIPILNSDIHGITDEMVKDKPMFPDVAKEVEEFLSGHDVGGYNITGFDIPLLAQELERCGIIFSLEGRKVIEVFNYYKKLRPQSLEAAYKELVDPIGYKAHNGKEDVYATLKVWESMMQKQLIPVDIDEQIKFGGLVTAVDFARKFKRREDGVVILNIGKHKGEPATEHPDFLEWMLTKDFTEDTKRWCNKLIGEAQSDYGNTWKEQTREQEPEPEFQPPGNDDLPF